MSKKEKEFEKIQRLVEELRNLDDEALRKQISLLLGHGIKSRAINIILKERNLK